MKQKTKFWLCQLFIMVVLFTLLSNCEKDENDNIITDIDGNVYHSVKIGTQIWMVENLRTTKYNDNTAIPNVTDGTAWDTLTTPAYCWYNNDAASYKATYGALYNGYTVSTGKLAPKGWHVPTNEEWTTLENYLIANGYNYDGTTMDNKIAKALASATGWGSTNITGAVGNTDYPSKRNATGFTALPGGYRWVYGTFFEVGHSSYYWCLSGNFSSWAWCRSIHEYESALLSSNLEKRFGFSVRCVKDF
jgi:uncharacterized protein (TIGR02145 family)